MFPNLKQLFPMLLERNILIFIAWQYFGLRVWWVGNSLFVSCLVANSHPSFSQPFCNHTLFICHALSPVAGRERTDPNCIVLEKETVLQKLQLSFFPTCFLCVERIFKFFGDTNFLTLRFHGAMCFASGSIFGNNRQGWRAGFEFLRLQPFLMLFVLRSQVSQG